MSRLFGRRQSGYQTGDSIDENVGRSRSRAAAFISPLVSCDNTVGHSSAVRCPNPFPIHQGRPLRRAVLAADGIDDVLPNFGAESKGGPGRFPLNGLQKSNTTIQVVVPRPCPSLISRLALSSVQILDEKNKKQRATASHRKPFLR